jgi:hypothetical protein
MFAITFHPRSSRHPRAHLYPLGGGPWLEDRSGTRVGRWAGLAGALLCLGSLVMLQLCVAVRVPPRSPQIGLAIFGATAGLMVTIGGLAVLGIAWLIRRCTQVCPACLCPMPRGATTCPHCQFHPLQEPHG